MIAHHRFVKTTPNPNATKNSKGELVDDCPLLLSLLLLLPAEGSGDAVGEVVDEMEEPDVGDGVAELLDGISCRI